MGIVFSFLFAIIGFFVYKFTFLPIIRKKRSNVFQLTIQGIDFNPVYAYPDAKAPQLAIDPDKRMFYITGKTPKVFHASEVTAIKLIDLINDEHGVKLGKKLSITVTDLEEPIRYIVFRNLYQGEQWYGRIQAVWNM